MFEDVISNLDGVCGLMMVLTWVFGIPYILLAKKWRPIAILYVSLFASSFFLRCFFLRIEFQAKVLPNELVGTWKDSGQTLILKSDSTYSLARAPSALQGKWKLNGTFLVLSGYSPMAVIRVNHNIRILSDTPEDPDDWSGHLGFRQI